MKPAIFFAEMIEIRNVDVVKGGKLLFKNFSWHINNSENWIVGGNNGCGKTFLLELLAGMLHTPRGEIHYEFVKGKSWDERYAEMRAFITYIPAHALQLFVGGRDLFYQQRYYSIDNSSVVTVRDLFGEDFGSLDALDIPESFSIRQLSDVEISRLSNGQLKKLLIVKNFLKGIPKLLLLDYPFEGLDYKSRENLSAFIDFVSKRHGVQVIMVEHQYVPACINMELKLNTFRIERVDKANRGAYMATRSHINLVASDLVSDGMDVIRIEDLNLKYDRHVVFSHFNWTVHRGERWALTGRNGAGKTTLFSLIFADHPQAYAQKIYLFGRRRGSGESIWDIKKKINYLGPEQTTFLDSKTVMWSVGEYVKNVAPGFDDKRFQQLVGHFKAEDFICKPVKNLSSGELQLLMVIICFLSEKELWLLDEPFQFLDPVRKRQLKTYLSSHLSKEITLILISHNDDDLAEWTDKRLHL